jgi:hypothetical protein
LSLTHARTGVSLVAKNPGLQIHPLRGAGLLSRGLQQAERRPEASSRAQMRSRCEAFGGRVGECIGCRKCRSGAFPAGQGLLPTALQFQYGGQPALRVAEAK